MLGETAADVTNDGASSMTAAEDPDAVLTGAGGVGREGERGAGGGKYSRLIPHLLELVAYQSGVDAVEVRVWCARVY